MANDLLNYQTYLESVRIPLRLACTTESGWPIAISLWFKLNDEWLFCATQKSARVVSYLRNDPRCAFEVAADQPPYCGVRGQAIASIDEDIGEQILVQLLDHHLGGTDNALGRNLLAKSEDEVAIIIKPVNVYTWDYSNRMETVVSSMLDISKKVCP